MPFQACVEATVSRSPYEEGWLRELECLHVFVPVHQFVVPI
jgi:hypothetical protein